MPQKRAIAPTMPTVAVIEEIAAIGGHLLLGRYIEAIAWMAEANTAIVPSRYHKWLKALPESLMRWDGKQLVSIAMERHITNNEAISNRFSGMVKIRESRKRDRVSYDASYDVSYDVKKSVPEVTPIVPSIPANSEKSLFRNCLIRKFNIQCRNYPSFEAGKILEGYKKPSKRLPSGYGSTQNPSLFPLRRGKAIFRLASVLDIRYQFTPVIADSKGKISEGVFKGNHFFQGSFPFPPTPPLSQSPRSINKLHLEAKDTNSRNLKKSNKKFIKPNLEEIFTHFYEMSKKMANGQPKYPNSSPQSAEMFYNYYEGNGWMVGRVEMKNWKAAAYNWGLNRFANFNNNQTEKQNGKKKLDWLT